MSFSVAFRILYHARNVLIRISPRPGSATENGEFSTENRSASFSFIFLLRGHKMRNVKTEIETAYRPRSDNIKNISHSYHHHRHHQKFNVNKCKSLAVTVQQHGEIKVIKISYV